MEDAISCVPVHENNGVLKIVVSSGNLVSVKSTG